MAGARLTAGRRVVAALAGAALDTLGRMPLARARRSGAALGDLARSLGVRRRVAAENLARAFPELSGAEREDILRGHYRELGRVIAEYARLPELARQGAGGAVVEARGLEHLAEVQRSGRGAILLSGHFGNFELGGAFLGRLHPTALVVRPLTNPAIEARVRRLREDAGLRLIDAASGTRAVYRALDDGQWVAMLADQDARAHGAFVPFLGRPASTALGPARIALATGAAIVMGFVMRRPDLGIDIDVEPPLAVDPGDDARTLTERHVAILERRVRRHPAMWFWLHRRWKTQAPAAAEPRAVPAGR